MGDRIMSRPLDPGADANWDNTFGTASKPPLVRKPTYEELVEALDNAVQSAFAVWEEKDRARQIVRRAKGLP